MLSLQRSCLSFALLSVFGRTPLLRTMKKLRIIISFPSICLLYCDGPCLTLYQQLMSSRGSIGVQTVSMPRTSTIPARLPRRPPGRSLNWLSRHLSCPRIASNRAPLQHYSDFQDGKKRDCIRLPTPIPRIDVPIRIGCRTLRQRTYALVCKSLSLHGSSLPPALQLLQSGEKPFTS